jgi:two-component system heavy metal sensor histidine kinase CusS
MFLRRTEPRSLASQLVLLFTPAAALLLGCALAVLYWIVVRHAFAEDRLFLADRISALRADFHDANSPATLNEQLKRLRGGEHPAYWVRVIDSDGRTLVETPRMSALVPANAFPTARNSNSAIKSARDFRARGKLFSLASIAEEKGGQLYTVQVAQDRSGDEEFSREFRTLLIIVLAFGILASAVIAITVTKRGLHPLAEMTRALRRIGPTHLKERVAPIGWPRELQPLATAFDEMLGRLEDSFTRLSQFSADLAHELRTPVANILGESQVTLTRARTPDEYRNAIESNVAECERLSAVIDNLLFLARAEAAASDIQQTAFEGRAEVEKIASFYQTVAEEQRVTISCRGEGEIYADPMLFSRAVSNLVENALRFTDGGGTIQIAIAPDATDTKVSVSDTGCGIAALHLSRVFDRFYRVDSSRSPQGAGLGLSLVKSITDLHGGSAAIESEVGRGTTVTLTFPSKRS